MANTVTTRAPAWADGVQVSGAEMRAAIMGSLYASAGLVRGLRPVQIPTPAMQIRVPAGICVVADGQNGFIPLELAAQTDLDIAASHATLPRIDSLVAEFVDNGGSSLYRLRVLTGTPNASPVAPTLPAGDQPTGKTLRVANIAVAAAVTTIVNANISLQTQNALLNASGSVPTVSSDGGRPTTPIPGDRIFRSDKLCDEEWNGTAWVEDYQSSGGPAFASFTPTLVAATTNPTLGTGSTRVGSYIRIGRLIHYNANIKFGTSGTAAGSGVYAVMLPVTAKTLAVGQHVGSAMGFDSSANNAVDGICRIGNSGFDRAELVINNTLAGNAAPWTWAASDQIHLTIVYEAAS